MDVEEEGMGSPGQIHHDLKEGAGVGARVSSRMGMSTRSQWEIKTSEEWADTRG